jgi:hypothetical protein
MASDIFFISTESPLLTFLHLPSIIIFSLTLSVITTQRKPDEIIIVTVFEIYNDL